MPKILKNGSGEFYTVRLRVSAYRRLYEFRAATGIPLQRMMEEAIEKYLDSHPLTKNVTELTKSVTLVTEIVT